MRFVTLPDRFTSGSMYRFIGSVITADEQPVSDSICLDFSRLSFIEPAGITALSNTIEWLRKRGTRCKYSGADPASEAIRFLDDSQFFLTYAGRLLREDATLRSTTIPLHRVSHAESFAWLENRFMPWLMSRLDMSRAALANVRTCLSEIFNNIKDHSGEDTGCAFAQHYPNRNEVVVGVSDFGIGIPRAIAKVRAFQRDEDAIRFACEEGATSKSLRTNMGAGLNLLIQNVVDVNGGELRIFSRSGKLVCRRVRNESRRLPVPTAGRYPGTFIELRFRTDTIEPIEDDREDLEW